MIGIYKITSPTKRVYIGQSRKIEERLKTYKTLKCKSQIKLYHSLKKHGVENHVFEIICECEISELNEKERYYQDLYSVLKTGLNCVLTKANQKPYHISDETRLKISLAGKSRKMTEENKTLLSIRNKGNKYSEGTKMAPELKTKLLKINTGNKYNLGNKSSESKKSKISQANKGNKYALGSKMTIEHKKLLMSLNVGKVYGKETRLKIAEARKKIIVNLETGVFHFGIKEISDTYEVKFGTITHRLNGRYKNNTSFTYV